VTKKGFPLRSLETLTTREGKQQGSVQARSTKKGSRRERRYVNGKRLQKTTPGSPQTTPRKDDGELCLESKRREVREKDKKRAIKN